MDTALYEKIGAWFQSHRVQMVNDIKTLVSIRSVSEYGNADTPYGQGCKKALDAYLAIARRLGFTVQNFDNHCAAAYLSEKDKTIAFWNHLDVVPEGEGWDFEPYDPIEKDDFLIGRGADDNKGPVVGLLYTLRCFHDLGIQTRCGLKLFVGCDEEHGMKDVQYYLERHPAADLTMIADCAYPVCYGEKGIMEAEISSLACVSPDILSLSGGIAANVVPGFAEALLRSSPRVLAGLACLPESIITEREGDTVRLSAHGKPCHAAFPQGGVSAIHELLHALLVAQLLDAGDSSMLSYLCAVTGEIYGTELGINMRDDVSGDLTCVGSLISMRERHICLQLNIRYCVTTDSDKLQETMANACAGHGFGFACLRDSKPNYFPREHPLVNALTRVYNDCTGESKEPYVMGGGTYARKFPCALGFGLGGLKCRESALFRPGHGGAHCPDEALDIGNFIKALQIFSIGVIEADMLMGIKGSF
jgi:succinyl-diaminopimelate desuccinylase